MAKLKRGTMLEPRKKKPLNKGAMTKIRILEATVKCVVKYGFEGLTAEKVAKRAKMNPSLIIYHFKTMAILLESCISHVMTNAREHTSIKLSKKSLENPIEDYINVTFEFMRLQPSYGYFRLVLFSRGGTSDSKVSAQLSEFFQRSQQRVSELLQIGIHTGVYREMDTTTMARNIHSLIVGNLIRYMGDPNTELEVAEKDTLEAAEDLLRN